MPSTEHAWSPGAGEILTVSNLLDAVRRSLEFTFTDAWIDGEIIDLKFPQSGHAYFTIADERCRIRAVCFKSVLRLLETPLAEGSSMLFRGRVTVYEQRGDLQFVVEHAEPSGDGLLRLQLEALKKKLAAEGLFSLERKRPLPPMPRSVAVVTSPTGAAVRDILQVLGRRAPWVDVYICPSKVQGEGAAAELLAALELAGQIDNVDTVIIGRGGGAQDDLSAFNDEALVRAVAACHKPVISAVGHETDFTLVDFAADHRAPTPSAAAELAVRETSHLLQKLKSAESSLHASAERAVLHRRARLNRLDPSRLDPLRVIDGWRIRADRAAQALEGKAERAAAAARAKLTFLTNALAASDPAAQHERGASKLEALSARLASALEAERAGCRNRLALAESKLAGFNPLAILSRGYSVARDARGRVIRSAGAVNPGEKVTVTLASGALGCEVEDVYER